jgi:hypothetical protein
MFILIFKYPPFKEGVIDFALWSLAIFAGRFAIKLHLFGVEGHWE